MKPILFNTEMVRAILDGRKTVTRRVIKPQPKGNVAFACMGSEHGTWGYPGKDAYKFWGEEFIPTETLTEEELSMRWTPPCRADDILYVRETWASTPDLFGEFPQYLYRADYSVEAFHADDGKNEITTDFPACVKWHPSIHMTKEAARLFLRVTDVRVERLQDITEEQARREGVKPVMVTTDIDKPEQEQEWHEWIPALPSFPNIWDNTIKKSDLPLYGWDANPWVWVIEFERCKKPEED